MFPATAVHVLQGNCQGQAGHNTEAIRPMKIITPGTAAAAIVSLLFCCICQRSALAASAPSFQLAGPFGVGSYPIALAVGDFNKDGLSDLAVANQQSDNVSVLLGNGDGTFLVATQFAAGTYPEAVAIGDFDGDGKADLAVANATTPGMVSVVLGRGDGSFEAAVAFGTGPNPASVAVGDFNGDQKADLAVATDSGVSVLLGLGNGSFQAA